MSKIPTTEKIFEPFFNSFPKYGISLAKNWEKEIIKLAKKHTKLHVKEALKAANENASLKIEETNNSIRYISHYCKNQTFIIDENSILNAYPLNNIK